MNRMGTAAALGVALLVGACTASGKPHAASPAARTMAPAAPTDLLVLRDGDDSGATPYAVVDGGDGRVLLRLPAGVPASDWHVLYSSHPSGASTVVRAIDTMGGSIQREISVAGAWRLPTIGLAQLPGGLSADGRTLVLESNTPASGSTTRFAIVATEGPVTPRVVTLSGRFTFDALSPDGTFLYVIEHLSRSDYLVRQVDVRTGNLAAGAILDKRNVDERMAGYAATQLPGADGWVYTVYRGEDGDFIHALDTQRGLAVCIDLPGTEATDEASAGHWGLALDATGHVLYAANDALGLVGEVSLDSFSVERMKTFPTATSGVTLAKFGHGEAVGGGRIAASRDGSMLYVLGERGVISVATSSLTPAARLGGDHTYRGLALSADGALYVVDDAGAVSRLAADGHVIATIDRHDFSEIVAVLATR
jgi:DNA-binding beta-propeller fold protein YncE